MNIMQKILRSAFPGHRWTYQNEPTIVRRFCKCGCVQEIEPDDFRSSWVTVQRGDHSKHA